MPPEAPPQARVGIEWNKVTWYSKLGAIMLFIGVVPALTFYIGMQYQAVKDIQTAVPVSIPLSLHGPQPMSDLPDITLYIGGGFAGTNYHLMPNGALTSSGVDASGPHAATTTLSS